MNNSLLKRLRLTDKGCFVEVEMKEIRVCDLAKAKISNEDVLIRQNLSI